MNVIETIENKLQKEYGESNGEAILVLIEKNKLFRRYTMSEIENAIERTIQEDNDILSEKGYKPFIYRSIKIQMLDVNTHEDKQIVLNEFEAVKLPIIILYQKRKIRSILRKILF
jgi:hypothetical protein